MNHHIQIKKAKLSDITEMLNIYNSNFSKSHKDFENPEYDGFLLSPVDEELFKEAIDTTYIATLEDKMVGILRLADSAPKKRSDKAPEMINTKYVSYVAVLPGYKGMGVGKKLFSILDSNTNWSSCIVHEPCFNKVSEALHKSAGFKLVKVLDEPYKYPGYKVGVYIKEKSK